MSVFLITQDHWSRSLSADHGFYVFIVDTNIWKTIWQQLQWNTVRMFTWPFQLDETLSETMKFPFNLLFHKSVSENEKLHKHSSRALEISEKQSKKIPTLMEKMKYEARNVDRFTENHYCKEITEFPPYNHALMISWYISFVIMPFIQCVVDPSVLLVRR